MFCVDVSLPQCTTPASRPRNVGKRKAQLVVAEELVLVAGCPSSDSEWEVPCRCLRTAGKPCSRAVCPSCSWPVPTRTHLPMEQPRFCPNPSFDFKKHKEALQKKLTGSGREDCASLGHPSLQLLSSPSDAHVTPCLLAASRGTSMASSFPGVTRSL